MRLVLGDELDSPRGRIYLIKEMLESGRPADEKVVRHVDRCLSCLACMSTCPSGVHYMHLVDHARGRFHEIVADYLKSADDLGFETITPIPMSARYGDNVTHRSESMSWHQGPTLLEHLETLDVDSDVQNEPFRMPVQWVNRPDLNFRGYSGTVVSGMVQPGDAIVIAQSGLTATVEDVAEETAQEPDKNANDDGQVDQVGL